MRTISLVLLVAVSAFAQLPQDQIFRMNNPAVFQLTVKKGASVETATAFCIRQDGLLATTWGMIAGASEATVRSMYDKQIKVLGVLASDRHHNIAIIKVDDGGLSEVQLGQSVYTVAKELVYIIGTAPSGSNVMLSGMINEEYKKARDVAEYQPVIPVEGEFSSHDNGGPILSGSGGRAIGVMMTTAPHTGDAAKSNHVAVVIPVEELRDLMKTMSAQSVPLAGGENYFDSPDGLYWAGRLDEVNGDMVGAESHYRGVLTKDPKAETPAFQLAYTLERQGKHNEAAEAYARFSSISPKVAAGYFNRGLILAAQEKWTEAQVMFEKATAIDTKFNRGWDNLGIALEKQQKPDKALAAYLKAREVKETDPWANMRATSILWTMQKWGDCAKAAKKGREAGVDSVQIYFLEADSYLHMRSYLQSWDLAHRGTERDVKDARFWAIMAESSAKSKNPDRAKQELETLRTLDAALATQVEVRMSAK
jgi:tetratricopeptide (TPR) repeat protein